METMSDPRNNRASGVQPRRKPATSAATIPVVYVAAAVATAAAVVGCGPGVPSASTATSRDSLGVAIVESTAPRWPESRGWRIDPAPTVDLAESGAGAAHEFHYVRDLLRTADGRLLVADGGSQQLRVYDPAGAFVRALGGEGDGPGEFRALWTLAHLPGDTIVAIDLRAGGPAAVFDLDQSLVETIRLPPNVNPVRHPTAVGRPASTADLRLWGRRGYVYDEQAPLDGFRRPPMAVVRYSPGRATDTVLVLPGDEAYFTPEADVIPVMGRRTHVVPTPGGGLVAGVADALEWTRYDPDAGAPQAIARILGVSLAVSREAWELERRTRLGPNPNPYVEELVGRLPVPARKPAYEKLLVDGQGNVWAGEFLGLARRDDPRKWYVWDGTGAWLGVVETPERFDLVRIGDDEVLGVRRDDNDVEHPQALRLAKPGG